MIRKVLIYTLKAERRQSIVLFDLTDNMHICGLKFQTDLCMSANDCQRTTSVDFGVINMYSMNN